MNLPFTFTLMGDGRFCALAGWFDVCFSAEDGEVRIMCLLAMRAAQRLFCIRVRACEICAFSFSKRCAA